MTSENTVMISNAIDSIHTALASVQASVEQFRIALIEVRAKEEAQQKTPSIVTLKGQDIVTFTPADAAACAAIIVRDEDFAAVICDLLTTSVTANDIAQQMNVRDIASEIDAEEIAQHIDCDSIASHIEAEDIADHIDMREVASHIDVHDIAQHIDMAKLCKALLKALSAQPAEA